MRKKKSTHSIMQMKYMQDQRYFGQKSINLVQRSKKNHWLVDFNIYETRVKLMISDF